MRFSSFLNKKNNEIKEQLKVIKDVLQENGMKVEDFLQNEHPYLFLKNTNNNLDFEGVRIYKVGSNLAYRIQKESKTEPYGSAYPLDVEEMFGDLITDMDEEKAAEKIKKALVAEFNNFFQKSEEAQEKINSAGVDAHNKIVIKGSSGDLSNTM